MKHRAAMASAIVLLALAFGYGVVHLLNLRFSTGDVYPPYSSFRSDPLGAKVFYESLNSLDLARVRRNLQPPHKLPDGKGCTLFVFGLPWDELSADDAEYRKLDAFVRNGGRLVVTLYPTFLRPRGFGTPGGTNRPAFKRSSDHPFNRPPVELSHAWDFDLAHSPVARLADATFPSMTVSAAEDATTLPETISWHSALVFTNVGAAWRVIYARESEPVMIERSLGRGTLVLATDSFFVSNEALRHEREPRLLEWLLGRPEEIIFNETHLGVLEQPGVAALARRFHLGPALAAFAVLALLFVWMNALSFVPSSPEQIRTDATVAGRESATGLANLIRRSVAPKDLLQTCLDEWHKSVRFDARVTPRRLEKVRAAVEAHNAGEKPNAVETYRNITRILNER